LVHCATAVRAGNASWIADSAGHARREASGFDPRTPTGPLACSTSNTIASAVAEPDGGVRPLGIISNRLESIRKLVRKLGPASNLRACYEAGPTEYVLYGQLTTLEVDCQVGAAPFLIPTKAGDGVKTDGCETGLQPP
jgi:hypothetical protein